ncbi:mediator complex subunit, partial [Ascosphaera atra]
ENGKWELSDEVLLEQVYEVHHGRSIVHLSFEHTGTYLALIDAGGHITFWSASGIAINSFTGAKTASSGGDNDALQPIGATWLGVCRRSLAFQNATREGEKRWNYAAHIRPPIGPLHPQSKAGFITVTRFGLVRLMYQQPDWSWGVSMVELEKIYFSDGILSHASVASAEGEDIVCQV